MRALEIEATVGEASGKYARGAARAGRGRRYWRPLIAASKITENYSQTQEYGSMSFDSTFVEADGLRMYKINRNKTPSFLNMFREISLIREIRDKLAILPKSRQT